MFPWKKKDEEARKKEDELQQLKMKNELLEKEVAEIREKVANIPKLLETGNSTSKEDQPKPQFQPIPSPKNNFPNSPLTSTNWSSPNQATGQLPHYGNSAPNQNLASAPTQNFGHMPGQSFGNMPAQNFGNMPAQNFGNMPAQNFGNMPPQNVRNIPPHYYQSSMMFPENTLGQTNPLLIPSLLGNQQGIPNFSSPQQNAFKQNLNPPKFQRNFQNYNSNQRVCDERFGNKRDVQNDQQRDKFSSSSCNQQERRGRDLRPEDRRFVDVKSRENKSFSSNNTNRNNQETEKERPLFQKTERDNRSRSQPRNKGPNDRREPAEFTSTCSNEEQSLNKEAHFSSSTKQPFNKGGFRSGRGGKPIYNRNKGPDDRRETDERQNHGSQRRDKEAGFQGHGKPFYNRNFNDRKVNFKRNPGKPRHNNQRDDDTDSDDHHSTSSGHACSLRGSQQNLSKLGASEEPRNSSGNQMPDVVKNSDVSKSGKGGKAKKKNQNLSKEAVEEVLSRNNLGPGDILKRFIGTQIPSLVEAICLNVDLNTKVQGVILMSDPDKLDPVLDTPKTLVDIVNFKMKYQNAKSLLM